MERGFEIAAPELDATALFGAWLGRRNAALAVSDAAVRRPELFRAIVLLDAPIIGPFRGSSDARILAEDLQSLGVPASSWTCGWAICANRPCPSVSRS